MTHDAAKITRRAYLTFRVMEMSGDSGILAVLQASEAVDSTALAHPEWDMDEHRTWAQWETEPS